MRILRDILATLLLLLLLAMSVVGVMAYVPEFWTPVRRVNMMGRNVIDAWRPFNGLFWFWLGTCMATLLTFVLTLYGMRRNMRIEVQMGDGRVVILESAIRKYVRSALADIPDINAKKIALKRQRQGLRVDIYAQVRTHENLPDLERRVIRRVRQALADEMGITAISAVHVYVKDFEVHPPHITQPAPPQPRETVQARPAAEPEPEAPAASPYPPRRGTASEGEVITLRPRDNDPLAPPRAEPPAPAPVPVMIEPVKPEPERACDEPTVFVIPEPPPAEPSVITEVPAEIEEMPGKPEPAPRKGGFFSRWRKTRTADTDSEPDAASASNGSTDDAPGTDGTDRQTDAAQDADNNPEDKPRA